MLARPYAFLGVLVLAILIAALLARVAVRDRFSLDAGITNGAESTAALQSARIDRMEAALAELRSERGQLVERSRQSTRLITALTARLQELEEQRSGAGSPDRPLAEPLGAQAVAEQSRVEGQVHDEQILQAQLEGLEDAISLDEFDSDWSEYAQSQIEEMLVDSREKGLALSAVECRTRLCRIEVTIDPNASEEQAMRALLDAAPWSGERFYRLASGGDPHATLYLAREGESLSMAWDLVR